MAAASWPTGRARLPAPLLGRFGHSAVWAGSEIILWGGRTGYDRQPLTRGVTCDPVTNRWRGEVDATDVEVGPPTQGNTRPPSSSDGVGGHVECAGLRLPPNLGETNTNLDMHDEVLQISYEAEGVEITIAVQYLDPACLVHPVIGPIIDHVLIEAFGDLATECADLRARLEFGALLVRGRPIDRGDVEAYIDRWCPEPDAGH